MYIYRNDARGNALRLRHARAIKFIIFLHADEGYLDTKNHVYVYLAWAIQFMMFFWHIRMNFLNNLLSSWYLDDSIIGDSFYYFKK